MYETPLEYLWDYIDGCFSELPFFFGNMLEFVSETDICFDILICFLISASVIISKRIFSIFTR